jgi:hypothetical protein
MVYKRQKHYCGVCDMPSVIGMKEFMWRLAGVKHGVLINGEDRRRPPSGFFCAYVLFMLSVIQ